jgi:predicted AAA+ superfamily ATPase
MREYNRNPLFFHSIINEKFNGKPVPLVFDEIHKHKNWRNILKGIYDTDKERMTLLVTGSARLGLYRKSGDSLVGRYFSYQIFPLGLPEAVDNFSRVLKDSNAFSNGDALVALTRRARNEATEAGLDRLLTFGGFPEPFLKGSPRFFRRWQREYRTLLTKEDVRDLSRISDIRGIEQLIEMLPARVGSPLSTNSLREDMGYHHATIANWIEVLKELYLVFTIRPWHRAIVRSIKKEPKLYFVDWSAIADPAVRFENLCALTLVRMASRLSETGVGHFEVMFIRDKEKREVDFVLVDGQRPVALFEAKEADLEITPSGRYYSNRLGIPYYQIVHRSKKAEAFPGNCFIIPAASFFMLCG